MVSEFGKRLHSARKMAGMSMDALAQASGSVVSKQAISKYERGQNKPGSEVLLAFAGALGVKVDYFFRTSQVEIAGFDFRKKSKLSKKEEEKIGFQTREFLQKYIEIERVLDISQQADMPVERRKIHNYDDIERAARDIRQNWNLGDAPINQLTELLEDKGFKIFEVDASDNFIGLSGVAEGVNIPVIAVFKEGDLVRKRFTIAHELAHLLLDFSDCQEGNHEKLCHAFAGAFLLPEEVIKEELGEHRKKITQWELKKLKGVYGISMQATMARAHVLGIISDQTYKYFNIYARKKGWHRGEPGQFRGMEKANRFKQLVLHAAAEQIVSYSKGAELLNMTLAEFESEVEVVS